MGLETRDVWWWQQEIGGVFVRVWIDWVIMLTTTRTMPSRILTLPLAGPHPSLDRQFYDRKKHSLLSLPQLVADQGKEKKRETIFSTLLIR